MPLVSSVELAGSLTWDAVFARGTPSASTPSRNAPSSHEAPTCWYFSSSLAVVARSELCVCQGITDCCSCLPLRACTSSDLAHPPLAVCQPVAGALSRFQWLFVPRSLCTCLWRASLWVSEMVLSGDFSGSLSRCVLLNFKITESALHFR